MRLVCLDLRRSAASCFRAAGNCLEAAMLFSLVLLFPLLAEAQVCAGGATASTLRSRIRADQNAILNLRLGATSAELSEFANASAEQRQLLLHQTMKAGAMGLLDGLLALPNVASFKMSPYGVSLPNGLASLNPPTANALIAQLEKSGGLKAGLIPAIRSLSKMRDKRNTLAYLEGLSYVASNLKEILDADQVKNSIEKTQAIFGLAAAMANKGGAAVSVANALFNTGSSWFELLVISRAVSHLSNATDRQLRSLRSLSARLQDDVQALQVCVKAAQQLPAKPKAQADNEAANRAPDVIDVGKIPKACAPELAMWKAWADGIPGDRRMIAVFEAQNIPSAVAIWRKALEADIKGANDAAITLRACVAAHRR